jgi:alpha-galactosidase
MPNKKKEIKITFIGGGSLNWTPAILRDVIFKKGMERTNINFRLLDIDAARLKVIKKLFDYRLKDWGADWVRIDTFLDADQAISGADFVIIAISTGGLATMKHDLKIPEKYGIYHTVGDTAGPGGGQGR